MKRKWQLKEAAPSEYINQFPEIPRPLLQVLFHRGLKEKAEIEFFLKPLYDSAIFDPQLLPDMALGIERTLAAIKNKEKITVYADYDADAVTAAAVMMRALKELGAEVDYYIPDRFSEGYGVNSAAIKEIAERGTKLIITVDCGVTAVEEVDVANSLGVDVVVTDHHHVPDILPKAVAVINQHRRDSVYPFMDLTGVGVAFKFVQALLKEAGDLRTHLAEGWEKWLLDLVAIGTVADCQNLLSENRMLVKYGLMVMTKTRWPGLKALLSVSGASDKPLTSTTIGFQLAPRINAAGRLAHADIALKLLLTDDALQAADLALQLENLNKKRQQLTESIMSEAREQIEEQLKTNKILLAKSKDWPKGVVGLVAGKLTEEYYRPVLVVSQDDQYGTGSARSIPGFNIIEAITYAGQHLVRFGGHDAAAGFTVENDKIEAFYATLAGYADTLFSKQDLTPVLPIDCEINEPDHISLKFADAVESLAPFGQGNNRPYFLFRNLKLDSLKLVGKDGKHAQLLLVGPGDIKVRTIAFSHGYLAKALKQGDLIDVVGELLVDEWNGNRRFQIRLIDWEKSENSNQETNE